MRATWLAANLAKGMELFQARSLLYSGLLVESCFSVAAIVSQFGLDGFSQCGETSSFAERTPFPPPRRR